MAQGSIRTAKRFAAWTLASGLLCAALPVGAQTPVPAGAEFQVNSYTTGYQRRSAVAAAPDGGFVVVWDSPGSFGTDTSSYSVQGQRYASDGSAQGAEFQVNAYTPGGQHLPSVAVADDGDFVVVWASVPPVFPDITIQGQRFASDGSVQGAQFKVNTSSMFVQSQVNVSVGAAAAGGFVVAWQSRSSLGTDTSYYSIQGQRYASDGSAQGTQFQVNTYTTGAQSSGASAVAVAPDGDFVVVWTSPGSFGTDTSGFSVQGQRYASNGSAQGGQFQVNTYTTNAQTGSAVAATPDGGFVVVWTSSGSSGTDASSSSVQGQRFASDGSAQGAPFQVNTYTTNGQSGSAVATTADGGFVVAWESYGSSGTDTSNFSIHGQRFASDGSRQGAELQVNTYTTSTQWHASVAAADGGNFVVVWDSTGSSGTDTSDFSVHAQRYRLPAVFAVPALSAPATFALGAALMLLATYALRRRA
jgi:hypothetical protein